jgi:hypothetical protein
MRNTFNALLGLLLVLTVAVSAAGQEENIVTGPQWFDMENCAFCKNLTAQPGLMDHMTWEHHDIANGVMTITTVHPDHKTAYLKAQHDMQAIATDLAAGKRTMADTPMCGHCMAYGMLTMSGAKMEYVAGATADVILITSDNPETVAKIKEFGQRNRTELAAMQAAKEAAKKEKTE